MNQLFHEVYGKYYQLLTKIMSEEKSTEAEIRRVAEEEGYGETAFSLLPSLVSEDETWHLLRKEGSEYYRITQETVERPLTLLEKRWLKTILSDSRIALFLKEERIKEIQQELADVDALFAVEEVDYFDQFQHGDPVENEQFQQNFRLLLQAIKSKALVYLQYQALDRTETVVHTVYPEKVEYSQKNDKFRLKARRQTKTGRWEPVVFNLSEMTAVEITDKAIPFIGTREVKEKQIVCRLRDDRDTLERAMFHFSNYRKVTQKTEVDNEYLLTIYYPSQDETELLINVLSFGPFLQVIEPLSFIRQIRYRLGTQKRLFFPKQEEKEKNNKSAPIKEINHDQS